MNKLPVPQEYIDDMRHYLPALPIQSIRDAWKHNATPLEVMRHLDRIAAHGIKGEA
jgi:hypothetical protein